MTTGQISPNIWLFNGSPIGRSISIIDAPKNAIVIDIANSVVYLKTSGYGDNSSYTTILTTQASFATLDGSTLPKSDPGNGKPWLNGNIVMVGS